MSNYVKQNLGKNEAIVKIADRNPLSLVISWVLGILFCWLLFIPLIKAIIATIRFTHVELGITNKRLIGKTGVVNTQAMDCALNKIQNVSCTQKFWGKIFNYATIEVNTAAGKFLFHAIKDADHFKGMIMAQIDQYEEDRIAQQASQMAQAMSSVLGK